LAKGRTQNRETGGGTEEIERLNTIIQVAMRQIIAPTPTSLMSHDGAEGTRK
jgi:hypothetical protein